MGIDGTRKIRFATKSYDIAKELANVFIDGFDMGDGSIKLSKEYFLSLDTMTGNVLIEYSNRDFWSDRDVKMQENVLNLAGIRIPDEFRNNGDKQFEVFLQEICKHYDCFCEVHEGYDSACSASSHTIIDAQGKVLLDKTLQWDMGDENPEEYAKAEADFNKPYGGLRLTNAEAKENNNVSALMRQYIGTILAKEAQSIGYKKLIELFNEHALAYFKDHSNSNADAMYHKCLHMIEGLNAGPAMLFTVTKSGKVPLKEADYYINRPAMEAYLKDKHQ